MSLFSRIDCEFGEAKRIGIQRRICLFSRGPVARVRRGRTMALRRHDCRVTESVPGFMPPCIANDQASNRGADIPG